MCDFLRNFLVEEVLVGGWEREKGIGDIGRVKMREGFVGWDNKGVG